MEINVLIDEELEAGVELSWLQSIIEQALTSQGIGANVELGLVMARGERVQQLNRDYLGKDEPTDVLAFAMLPEEPTQGRPTDLPLFIAPPDGVRHLGEVIISYPQAVTQAEEHQHSLKKEIAILTIHGLLHLLGYDHEQPEPEQQMKAKEAEILSIIEGIEN